MWRRRLTIAAAALLATAGLPHLAHVAHAGALAEVSHGISSASDNDDHASPASSNDNDNGDSGSSSSGNSSSSWGESGCCHIDPVATLGYTYGPPAPSDGVSSEFYLGGQSVEDSDGAVTFEVRATYADFGLGVRGTTFYEQVKGTREKEYLHLDMWWVGGLWRVDHNEKSSLWLELGLAGLDNNDRLTMTGAAVGFHAQRWLGGAIAVTGGARRFWFEDDVAANELFAGVQASVLQVSYRIVDFNVGPPLHGPEVGILLTF